MSKKPFSIFGFGRDGVPASIRTMFLSGERDLTVALAEAEAKGVSPENLRLLAERCGLISPGEEERPIIKPWARERLSVPPQVKVPEFLETAGRSALALALASRRDRNVLEAIREVLERVEEGRWELSKYALHVASKQSWTRADDGTLIREKDERKGIERQTIKNWIARPEFILIAETVATGLVQGGHLRHGGRPGGTIPLSGLAESNLSDREIRDMAVRFPAVDILWTVAEHHVRKSSMDLVRRMNSLVWDLRDSQK